MAMGDLKVGWVCYFKNKFLLRWSDDFCSLSGITKTTTITKEKEKNKKKTKNETICNKTNEHTCRTQWKACVCVIHFNACLNFQDTWYSTVPSEYIKLKFRFSRKSWLRMSSGGDSLLDFTWRISVSKEMNWKQIQQLARWMTWTRNILLSLISCM